MTGIAFTDTLPGGLVVASPNGLTGACAGALAAAAGGGSFSLSGVALAATASCSFSVNVTGTTAGNKTNITGAITSNEGGTGMTASATLAVVAPPSLAVLFGSANIPLNGVTSLTYIITNPAANTVALTGVGLTDALPAGLTWCVRSRTPAAARRPQWRAAAASPSRGDGRRRQFLRAGRECHFDGCGSQ